MCDINLPSVILAGGQSKRMKRKDKSFLEVGDKTLLDMTIERLQLQSRMVAINTNSYSIKYDGPKKTTLQRIMEFVD